jgi:hypothetical protein
VHVSACGTQPARLDNFCDKLDKRLQVGANSRVFGIPLSPLPDASHPLQVAIAGMFGLVCEVGARPNGIAC